jgi:acyl carrier protein
MARESSLLSHVAREAQVEFPGDKRRRIRDSLLTAQPEERQGILEAYIQKEVARVLQLDPSRLDVKRPLNTVGLDSLMSIELKTRIETGLGVVLPMINLLQGPSITHLATQLLGVLEEHPGHSSGGAQDRKADVQLPPTRDVNREEAKQLLVRLDRLSDDEVNSLLGEMLAGEDAR